MLIGRYSSFLDANVLQSAFLRAALLWFADERLLRPVWSKHVLDEWRTTISNRHAEVAEGKLDRIQAILAHHFPDAEIRGYEPFIDAFALPAYDARHVLAAAIVGRCNGIITANPKRFPAESVEPLGIEVIHPDEFIVNIIDLDEKRAVATCRRHRQAMSPKTPTPEQYLSYFDQCGLIQAQQRLSASKDLL